MEMEVGAAPFGVHNNCVSCFWVCSSVRFNQIGLKKFILCSF